MCAGLRKAEVFVNLPVKSIAKAYSYRLPEEIKADVGWRVVVPFGGRRVEGFVVSVTETEADDRLKDILETVDDEAWFTPRMTAAAHELAAFYLCSPAELMRLFMPGKSGVRIEVCYEAAEADASELQDPDCRAVFETVCQAGGSMAGRVLRRLIRGQGKDADSILEHMVRHGWLQKQYLTKKRAAERYEEELRLCCTVDDGLRSAFRRKPAQLRLLEVLAAAEGRAKVASLLTQGVSRATIKAVCTGGFAELMRVRLLRDSYSGAIPVGAKVGLPPLTTAQEVALARIFRLMDKNETGGVLLYGVTGSGKTRVYLEAAAKARRMGRQALVLVPEIALTGQLVRTFGTTFAGDMIVIHSRLSVAERNDAFLRIRRGEAGVIIGARSALFTPAADIGVIIMDEEQDMSYKQDEAPRYHARVVAETLARLHGATLILGSATPAMETFYRAREGELSLLSLPERMGGRSLPEAETVDMREELQKGNRHVLSRAMQRMIRETIEGGNQMILMLNRRGYSTFVMCRACGYVVECPQCGLPMVYHRSGRLVCHHCDIHDVPPGACPKCGSLYIKYFGSGTEKLEEELAALVPEARVVRMDRDTTQGKFAHADILRAFREGKYDILLGTQMVAKGHDIPNVTAVGIISADASLHVPEFRAAERCFMLITQTAGRAGRGETPGRVLVQCYTPEHYAVETAIRQDYEAFYEAEIGMRKALFFPPFCRLVKLTFLAGEEAAARAAAQAIKERFLRAFAGDARQQIVGPAPDVIAKLRNVYRFNLLIKTAALSETQVFLRTEALQLRTDVWIDIDPIMA